MQTNDIYVTYFKPRRLFKKAVGTHAGDDGKPRTAIFWLGRDQRRAVEHVRLILHAQVQFREEGAMEKHWTPETLIRIKRAMKRADELAETRLAIARETLAAATAAPSRQSTTSTPQQTQGKTLHQATKAYVEAMERKNVSDAHKDGIRHMMERLRKDRADVLIADIDYAWLDELADHYKARPKMKNGKRMSAATAKHIIGYVRSFFVWCDDVEFGGWQAPRKLLKPFKVSTGDLMTAAERREAATIEQFDMATLRKLYQHANEKTKSWILAGLFCGATQFELAVLQRDEIDLNTGIVNHIRNKTAIQGQFWIPSELVKMLRTAWAKTESPLAFVTRDSKPLVHFADKKKSDAVRLAWNRIRKAAGLPDALPFKYLRKFAADYALRAGGEAMGQIALSHSRKTMMAEHYTSTKDFARFHEIQKQMHADLATAKFFEPSAVSDLADNSNFTIGVLCGERAA